MNVRDATWLAIVSCASVLALIAGTLIGVHWYDSKYRPEISRYLKECHHER